MSFYQTIYQTLRTQTDAAAPRETALVLQSRAAGRRLLAALAAHCGPLLGVSAQTPYSLAMDVCGELLSAPGAPRLMNDDEAATLLLLECIYPAKGTFTKENAGSLAAARELWRTMQELERAQVGPLTASDKQTDLQALRECYARVKKDRNCIDRADLFALAEKAAQTCPPRRIVALPAQRFSPLEHSFLKALCGGADPELVPLAVPAGYLLPGVALDGLPAEDPLQNRSAANTGIVNCMGVDVEVDRVFRDILEQGYALDRCAVVYCDGSYAPLLYEAAGRYGVPVCMAAGIPIGHTRLNAALTQIAELRRNFYDAERIRSLLTLYRCLYRLGPYYDAAAQEKHKLTSTGGAHLADTLLDYRVGWGEQSKYMEFIARYQADVKARIDNAQNAGDGDQDGAARPYEDYLEQSRIWKQWLDDLFLVADGTALVAKQKAAMLRILASIGDRTPEDRAANAAACAAVSGVEKLPDNTRLVDWLRRLLEGKTVLARNAAPGALLCLPLRQACLACRERIYLLGLGHDVFSGEKESAVLLDDERRALSPALALGTDGAQEKLFRFAELLLRHDGELILSYPGYDCARQIELEDAQALNTVRTSLGLQVAAYHYLPQNAHSACDALLTEPYTRTRPPAPAAAAPATDFADWVRAHTFSPSAIETALTCPFKFYMQYVLGVRPTKPPRWRPDRWLDANERGTVVHAVLQHYYDALNDAPNMDDAARSALEEALFTEEWDKCLKHNPPPNRKEAKTDERALQRSMVRAAIEWTQAQGRTVERTEQAFGGDDAPVVLELDGGRRVKLKGTIDRLDRCNDGACAVLDYKTGDPARQEEQKQYHLQHYLYTEAERILSDGAVDPKEAGYLMLAADPVSYLKAEQADHTRSAQSLTALLEKLENEDTCLEALPWAVTETGELADLHGTEERDRRWGGCSNYCEFAALCPLKEYEETQEATKEADDT